VGRGRRRRLPVLELVSIEAGRRSAGGWTKKERPPADGYLENRHLVTIIEQMGFGFLKSLPTS
jgi:hypothetical protein